MTTVKILTAASRKTKSRTKNCFRKMLEYHNTDTQIENTRMLLIARRDSRLRRRYDFDKTSQSSCAIDPSRTKIGAHEVSMLMARHSRCIAGCKSSIDSSVRPQALRN